MKKINPDEINENIFKLIGKDWFLLTAGNIESYNTMTASWGGMGVLWNKKVVFCFVRPVRYTYDFMENTSGFTLCFFDEEYRDALNFCGKYSGRDVDKAKQTNLIPQKMENGKVYFEQAKLILECKKIYTSDLNPDSFLAKEIHSSYPQKDYHRMYIGEIENCFYNSNKVL